MPQIARPGSPLPGPVAPPIVHLRDARPADGPDLLALYHEAYALHADPHRAPVAALRDTLADVEGYLREGPVLVAEDDGALVGSVALRPIANVRRLAVRPALQRRGLASQLLEAAVERARRERFAWAMLDTFEGHPWLPGFYAGRGFTPRSIEHFPDGTRWVQFRRKL